MHPLLWAFIGLAEQTGATTQLAHTGELHTYADTL